MNWLESLFRGVSYTITQHFGYTGNPNYAGGVHTGVDIAIPQGTPLYAPVSGEVVFAGLGNIGPGIGTVVIRDQNGVLWKFGHLSGWNVTEGSWIVKGAKFGHSGGAENTFGAGYSTGPHVHFEQWIDGKPVDPEASGAVQGAPGIVVPSDASPFARVPFSREALPSIFFALLGLALVGVGALSMAGVI